MTNNYQTSINKCVSKMKEFKVGFEEINKLLEDSTIDDRKKTHLFSLQEKLIEMEKDLNMLQEIQ